MNPANPFQRFNDTDLAAIILATSATRANGPVGNIEAAKVALHQAARVEQEKRAKVLH